MSAPDDPALPVVITAELASGHDALALAQLCKRITYEQIRLSAIDANETERMIAALDRVRRALAEVGYAPR